MQKMNYAAGLDMHHPHLLRICPSRTSPGTGYVASANANLYSYIRHEQSPWQPRGSLFVGYNALRGAVGFLHSKVRAQDVLHRAVHAGLLSRC